MESLVGLESNSFVSAAQTGKVWRIGFISGASRSSISEILAGFPQGMRELGYVEGKDFRIEWRFAEGNYDRFPDIAAELVRLKVDVFVLGTPAAVRAARQATTTIPIVMGYSTDPVGGGSSRAWRVQEATSPDWQARPRTSSQNK